jgi:HEAT repeat protein
MPDSYQNKTVTVLRPERVLVVTVLMIFAAVSIFAFAVVAGKWKSPEVKQLADELRNGDDPADRCRAAWRLGEGESRGGAVWCVDGLRDKDATVRLVSAWALGEIKDRGTIAPLTEALTDDDALVREMAALALGEIEDPSAVDPLVDAFEADEKLRLAVVWALGEIASAGSSKAARAREDCFESLGRRAWRNEQVWAGELDRHPPRTGDVNDLLDRLRSDDAESRREAALGLGYMGGGHRYESESEVERVVDALIQSLRDPVPEVRAAATWSLDEINPSRSASYHREHSVKSSIDKFKKVLGLS